MRSLPSGQVSNQVLTNQKYMWDGLCNVKIGRGRKKTIRAFPVREVGPPYTVSTKMTSTIFEERQGSDKEGKNGGDPARLLLI